MNWHIDEHGRLVITISPKEQRALSRQGCEPAFESDDFMHRLLEPIATDGLTWLPQGCTDDLTAAPMLGILGEPMPGPDDPQDAIGMGLVHVGEHDGRRMYRPILKRWAFMDYAVTSPQQELAETGKCVWQGGDFWASQEAAKQAVAEVIGC